MEALTILFHHRHHIKELNLESGTLSKICTKFPIKKFYLSDRSYVQIKDKVYEYYLAPEGKFHLGKLILDHVKNITAIISEFYIDNGVLYNERGIMMLPNRNWVDLSINDRNNNLLLTTDDRRLFHFNPHFMKLREIKDNIDQAFHIAEMIAARYGDKIKVAEFVIDDVKRIIFVRSNVMLVSKLNNDLVWYGLYSNDSNIKDYILHHVHRLNVKELGNHLLTEELILNCELDDK